MWLYFLGKTLGFYPFAPVGWDVGTVAPTVFSVLGVVQLWDSGLSLSRMPFCSGEDVHLMATTFCRGESRLGSEILRTELAEGVDCGDSCLSLFRERQERCLS